MPENSTHIEKIPALPFTPSAAQAWQERLATQSNGVIAKALYHGLKSLSREPMDAKNRIAVAQALVPLVDRALQVMRKNLEACEIPLNERNRHILDLSNAIAMQTAGVFQLAAVDLITRNKDSKSTLAPALFQAIKYLHHCLDAHYSLYIYPREQLWHDIHNLYMMATERGVHTAKLKQDRLDTIEKQYLHVNACALCLPNTLRYGEYQRVHEFFADEVSAIKILSSPNHESRAICQVLINSDEPAHITPLSEAVNSATTRIIDMSGINKKLEAFMYESSKNRLGIHNESYKMLNYSLAKRIHKAFNVVTERKYKRFVRNENVSVLVGFSNLTRHYKNDEKKLNELRQKETPDDLFAALTHADQSVNPWDAIEQHSGENTIKLTDKFITVPLLNSSTEGYGLLHEGEEAEFLRPGEVVGIYDPQGRNELQVGVVKWVERNRSGKMQAGIQLMAESARLITLYRPIQRSDKIDTIRGLEIFSQQSHDKKSHLLLPSYQFSVGETLNGKLASKDINITLTTIDETRGVFAYCEFVDQGKDKRGPSDEEKFEAIWDSL